MTTAEQSSADLTGDYRLDLGHSRIGFSARHAMVTKVHGEFTDVEGRLHIDVDDPTLSTASVTINPASVTTHHEKRDGHLRSPDFLDVEHHPAMTFKSTSAEKVDDVTYRLTGDLTIRDVTRPVTIDFEYTGTATDHHDNKRIGFEGHAQVNRKDWGLTWNEILDGGGLLLSDKIGLELDISAIKESK